MIFKTNNFDTVHEHDTKLTSLDYKGFDHFNYMNRLKLTYIVLYT
jgi:hypothetical protein